MTIKTLTEEAKVRPAQCIDTASLTARVEDLEGLRSQPSSATN